MIFITGMVRSGTTFATNFVSIATSRRLAAQPLPLLYVEVMRNFRRHLGLRFDGYPLSDCVFHNAYPWQALVDFLDRFSMTQEELRGTLEANRQYSGQQTRISVASKDIQMTESSGFDMWVSTILRSASFEGESGFAGSKETSCEEFIPYFADRGWFVVLVIRDIRDVICSLNLGEGLKFTGLPKPTLFNIRQWRKSVEFALAFGKHPNVCVLRYEDIVSDPRSQGSALRARFKLWADKPVQQSPKCLREGDMQEIPNSSFPSASPGEPRYRNLLKPEFLKFVESLTWRELKWMGCQLDSPGLPAIPSPEEFADPFESDRSELGAYKWSVDTYEEETGREKILRGERKSEDIPGAFIFDSSREQLSLLTHDQNSGA